MVYSVQDIEKAFERIDDTLALMWDVVGDYEDGDGDIVITDSDTIDDIIEVFEAVEKIRARAIRKARGAYDKVFYSHNRTPL